MTLPDANNALPALPEASIDLPEAPINPPTPDLLPDDLAPITPAESASTPGTFAHSEIIIADTPTSLDPLAHQATPEVSDTRQTALANSEFIAAEDVSPATPLAEPPLAPIPPSVPGRSKRLDARAILAICTAFLLLIVCVGGLIFDIAYYQPYRVHASTTATAMVIPTTTAHAAQTHVASYEQTQIAQQQATTTAEQNIYTQATSSRPFLNESLKHQSSSGWDEGVIWKNSSCTFKNGSYMVHQPNSGYFLPCFAENPLFTNFAFQVDINILKGDDGGVIFRSDVYYATGYLFDLDNYGDYYFYTYTASSTASSTLLNGKSYDYRAGQKNTLTVIARGNTFYFYLNQHFLDSTTDKTFGEGGIGLLATDYQDSTTIAYNNLKVWLLV